MVDAMRELVYGIHVIQEILNHDPRQILYVYIIRSPLMRRLKCLFDQIVKYNISIQKCDRSYLDARTKGALHQGIVAEIVRKNYVQEDNLLNFLITYVEKEPLLLLVLDGIIDPHNLGACLRTADAAGVHLVIAPKDRSARLNDTVRKVASGSADRIPFLQVTNLSRTLRLLRKNNIWIVGTTVTRSARIIFDSKLVGSLAVVMGSEESGIRRLTERNCDELVNIPILKSTISLNVSVATGICLFEVLRQRRLQR